MKMKKLIAVFFVALLAVSCLTALSYQDLFSELDKDENASAVVVAEIVSQIGEGVNLGTSWGYPALGYACAYCSEDVVAAILDSPYIDVNILDTSGNNALFAELGKDDEARLEVVEKLIEKGVDPNVGISWGYPPLSYAIRYCDEEIVDALLAYDAVDVNILDTSGNNALFAELGKDDDADYEIVAKLIEKGVDTTVGTFWGYNPTEYAREYCSTEIAELVEKGASSIVRKEDAVLTAETSETVTVEEPEVVEAEVTSVSQTAPATAVDESLSDWEKIVTLISQAPSYSGIVLINQSLTKTNQYTDADFKLVVIGPDCHKLPGWFFYSGKIDTLIILSDDLTSNSSLDIISNSVSISNTFANVPYFFVEDVVKRALDIQ